MSGFLLTEDSSGSISFFLLLQTSRSEINRREYTSFSLNRVTEFLPELDTEIREKLRVGRKNNEEDAGNQIAKWEASASDAPSVSSKRGTRLQIFHLLI